MKQRKAARKTGRSTRVAKVVARKRKVSRPLALPAECGIASAPALQTSLLKRVKDASNVQIDASAIQRIDTASLQLMAAFTRDRHAAGLGVEWLGVAPNLLEVARLLDLTSVLGFDSRAAA